MIIGQLIVLIISFLLAAAAFPGQQVSTSPPGNIGKVAEPVVTINITNTQPTPTPKNFDQLIKVDWGEFRTYLNQNLDNVAVFNSTIFNPSHELHAWIEDNESNTSSSGNIWINLEGTIIPAKGSITLYLRFLPKNATWSKYWGTAPQLTSIYGEHDNGAKVFPFYQNFSGTALDGGTWEINNVGGDASSYYVNDGLHMQTSYAYGSESIITTAWLANSSIVEVYIPQQTISAGSPGFTTAGLSDTNQEETFPFGAFGYKDSYLLRSDYSSSTHFESLFAISNENPLVGSTGNLNLPNIEGMAWPEMGTEYLYLDSVPFGEFHDSSIPGGLEYHLYLGVSSGGAGQGNMVVQFLRSRALPPNNVMPLVSVSGQVSNGTHYNNASFIMHPRSDPSNSLCFCQSVGDISFQAPTSNYEASSKL